jgi:hypothetical protein
VIRRLKSRVPLEDISVGVRFLRGLPGFLRCPVSLEEARTTLRRRLERRDSDFLALARRTIYANQLSPYRRLLAISGCAYEDLERLVRQDGLEAALWSLYRSGVFLTVDELKGRRPAVRGSASIAVDPGGLRNPYSAFHLLSQSGGSRGPRTPVPVDLAFIRDQAVDWRLALDGRGATTGPYAQWTVPGTLSLINLVESAGCGVPKTRWFSQLDPAAPGLHPRYRWSARLLRWGSLLAGVPIPRPEHVPLERALPVARWLADALAAGGRPELGTPPSAAVRVCRAALEAGLDLRGALFSIGGEPLTAARLIAIDQAGAEAVPHYRSIESGRIASGCLAPDAPDDLHLFHDLLALIQPGPDGTHDRLPSRALLVSSLRSTAPLILLNVSLGDHADIVQRSCRCPLEQHGWTTHLRNIRSFEKLSAGGMTFLDQDVIRVLEEVLPARFGGGPIHYQLVEDETEDGRPHLRLLVDPVVGLLDSEAVADAFLTALGGGSGVERVMELHWRQARFLEVDRRPPHVTAAGKVLHLHRSAPAAKRQD